MYAVPGSLCLMQLLMGRCDVLERGLKLLGGFIFKQHVLSSGTLSDSGKDLMCSCWEWAKLSSTFYSGLKQLTFIRPLKPAPLPHHWITIYEQFSLKYIKKLYHRFLLQYISQYSTYTSVSMAWSVAVLEKWVSRMDTVPVRATWPHPQNRATPEKQRIVATNDA